MFESFATIIGVFTIIGLILYGLKYTFDRIKERKSK